VKELRSALARLQGRVVQCHQRFQVDGIADVKVAVNPSGTVESTSLAGEFEGTPTGDCIVRAVSAASFPTFDGTESVRVSHSFPLQ
jgi:predicted PP-loop superfamily ATPase